MQRLSLWHPWTSWTRLFGDGIFMASQFSRRPLLNFVDARASRSGITGGLRELLRQVYGDLQGLREMMESSQDGRHQASNC